MLARANHRAVDVGELARVLLQGACEGGAGIDLGAQHRHQMPLALVFSLVGQRRERALQRQARRHQTRELPRPDGQCRGAKHRPREQAGAQRTGRSCQRGVPDRLHDQGHQRLRAQLAAGRLGGVGLDDALAGHALIVKGFKAKGGHAGSGAVGGQEGWQGTMVAAGDDLLRPHRAPAPHGPAPRCRASAGAAPGRTHRTPASVHPRRWRRRGA